MVSSYFIDNIEWLPVVDCLMFLPCSPNVQPLLIRRRKAVADLSIYSATRGRATYSQECDFLLVYKQADAISLHYVSTRSWALEEP